MNFERLLECTDDEKLEDLAKTGYDLKFSEWLKNNGRPVHGYDGKITGVRVKTGSNGARFVPCDSVLSSMLNPEPAKAEESKPEDQKTFERLAALSRAEYDRVRKAEAAVLGIKTSTLDAEVDARRPRATDTMQGATVEFPAVEPWQASVNGADVLSAVSERVGRYVVMPAGASDATSLYVATTHCPEAFDHTPRLNACSAEKNCGKTTLLDVLASMVPRPLRAESITPAVMFRLVASQRPTLLLDEVDSYRLDDKEELRGLLNAGHKRGGMAYRCEGDCNTVRAFPVYAPAVLAGIGALPGTLHDRSIVIKLERARPGEVSARFDSRRVEYEAELCRKLARWTGDNFDKLRGCEPQLPEMAFNRLADNWRPLFAIAEIAGGDWPQRAHSAFMKLTATGDFDAQGIGTLLLADIAGLFEAENADRLASTKIAESLAAIEGRPWAEWGRHRKPISTNQLANQLRRFGISPRVIRVGDETPRDYLLEDFADAFSRYLPSTTPRTDRNNATDVEKSGTYEVSEVQHARTMLHPENGLSQSECCTVAPCTGVETEKINISDGEALL
jgi:putative DNA primase/helicase